MHFADEAEFETNATAAVMRLVEHEKHRQALIAKRTTRDDTTIDIFDIHIKDEQETVFFDVKAARSTCALDVGPR